jgi:glyoxylase I family protein
MFTFHHVHLICRDLEGMIRFWTETLGATLVLRRTFGTADGATLDLAGIRFNLRLPKEGEALQGGGARSGCGYDHVALEVTDMVEAGKRLTGGGYPFIADPVDRGTRISAFIRGPEGILIELMEVRKTV